MLELCGRANVDLVFFVVLLFLNYNYLLLTVPRRRVEHFYFLILAIQILAWIVDDNSISVVSTMVLVNHVTTVVFHLSILLVILVSSV
jgi:hypothetical protein